MGYDPAKLLLFSDHVVVKGYYVEKEQNKPGVHTLPKINRCI